jgi:hypothetical protein
MGGGAAAAAAAARLRAQQEEEEMTTYSAEDLARDWEFKMLRSSTGSFRSSATLHRVLAEEARAGWTLVEKFDDQRIRLKRPMQARLADANLPPGVDPYRTQYGMSPVTFALVLVVVVFAVLACVFAVAR